MGRDTAGRDRIVLAPARGNPTPIPPERLGAWWRAAIIAPSRVAADYYRFQLLTGCRGGEIHGSKRHGYEPIKVDDVDLEAGKIILRDTKNRSDHKLLLSRQALEIAKLHCTGRKRDEPLFPIVDARKTLAWINGIAKTAVQGHGLRATFASTGAENWTSMVATLVLRSTVVGAQLIILNGGVVNVCFHLVAPGGSSTPSRVSTSLSSTS